MQIVVTDTSCPTCGAEETHPTDKSKVLIRAFKVHTDGKWWSQCLICSGFYKAVSLVENRHNHDPKAGWFCEDAPQ